MERDSKGQRWVTIQGVRCPNWDYVDNIEKWELDLAAKVAERLMKDKKGGTHND